MAGVWHFGVTELVRTTPIAASEVPFRLHPSHFNTWKLSINSIALNTSVFYEHSDIESKTNDN